METKNVKEPELQIIVVTVYAREHTRGDFFVSLVDSKYNEQRNGHLGESLHEAYDARSIFRCVFHVFNHAKANAAGDYRNRDAGGKRKSN